MEWSIMSQHKVSQFDLMHVSLRSYVIGFVSCLVLTGLAYYVAVSEMFSDRAAVLLIGILAITQTVVQLRKFLHVGVEFKPRWKLLAFMSMLIVVLIIVIGSLWIMSNLNYRMIHSPEHLYEYVESQNSL
jgi:cytochrome o ubiquinol oxidase subunit IV